MYVLVLRQIGNIMFMVCVCSSDVCSVMCALDSVLCYLPVVQWVGILLPPLLHLEFGGLSWAFISFE